jgi:hypothetical protein
MSDTAHTADTARTMGRRGVSGRRRGLQRPATTQVPIGLESTVDDSAQHQHPAAGVDGRVDAGRAPRGRQQRVVPRATSAAVVRSALRSREDLRRAILLREIIGPPASLRPSPDDALLSEQTGAQA